MSNFRSVRWFLPPILMGLLLMAAATSAPAWASGYGQLLRFDGKGTEKHKEGHAFNLEDETTRAFGVDAENGDVLVGDEEGREESEEFRIQEYSHLGVYLGKAVLQPGEIEEKGKVIKAEPSGMEEVAHLEGFAVAPGENRIYALVTYDRSRSDTVDAGKEVAGALYAFKTTPEVIVNKKGESESVLPSATANPEGLLASTEALKASSETLGQALLEPSGIAYDPALKEVVILGRVDESESGMHTAVDRVSPAGTLTSTYVDTHAGQAGNSPVVSNDGAVYFESDEAEEILEIKPGFGSEAVSVFQFAEPEGFVSGPFKNELVELDEETDEGGALAIFPGPGANEGRLVALKEINEMTEEGKLGAQGSYGAAVFDYTEEAGQKAKVSELGWTGGVPGPGGKKGSCEVGFGNVDYPQVAAGPENSVLVLSMATNEVIKFGEGGTGCPAATLVGGVEATLDGKTVTEPSTATKITLGAKVLGANVLSVTWQFGDGDAEETVQTPSGEQTQIAEVVHKFAKAGKLKVEATIHTDDLATPELKVATEIIVNEPPKIIPPQPANQTKKVGESVTFEATAEGVPTPTVVWEVSTPATKEFKVAGAGTTKTSGHTVTASYTVSPITAAENGNEYRAKFTNSAGEALTTAATMTVEPAPEKLKIIKSPESKTVTEGQNASFEATASGFPVPTVQWEESTNGGGTWTTIPGATSGTLSVPGTTLAESGDEYRATFTNTVPESLTTTAATLTVNAKEPPRGGGGGGGGGGGNTGGGGGGGTGEVLGVKEGSPHATVAGTSLSVSSSGAVVVKVSCPTGVSTCTGSITLRTLKAVVAHVSSRAQQAKAKASILTLASGSFTVAGGQVKSITLHLSSAARKLLARSHVLPARATVVAHDPAGASNTALSTVTLRAAKRK